MRMVRAQRVACSTRTFHNPRMYLTLALQEERVYWPETVKGVSGHKFLPLKKQHYKSTSS